MHYILIPTLSYIDRKKERRERKRNRQFQVAMQVVAERTKRKAHLS